MEVTYLYWEATYVMLFCVARSRLIFFSSDIFGFFSADSSLVTPDTSRATTPVEDSETFNPSRPSLSPANSILLPIGKIPSYLDVALKALTLHTEARTSFITYAPSLLPPSPSPINLTKSSFFSPTTQILAAEFTQTRIHSLAVHRAVVIRKGGSDAHLAYA